MANMPYDWDKLVEEIGKNVKENTETIVNYLKEKIEGAEDDEEAPEEDFEEEERELEDFEKDMIWYAAVKDDFTEDPLEKVKNWKEAYLYLFPNNRDDENIED